MKVGLVRHFKVTHGYPKKYITAEELEKWEKDYNNSDVEKNEIDLSQVQWDKCFSSDLYRARITAESCFDGNIIYLEELREVTLSPFFQKKIRLPLLVHVIFIKFAWLVNHKSQQEKKSDVLKRVNRALDIALQSGGNVLIISHGGIMMYMRKELQKRGFRGDKFRRPKNGVLYTFDN